MEEIYIDQAFRQTWPISTFLTPLGIRRLDTRFMHRIIAFGQRRECVEYAYSYGTGKPVQQVENRWNDTCESLQNDIEKCHHLHQVIKNNLFANLKNVAQSRQEVTSNDSVPHTFLVSS